MRAYIILLRGVMPTGKNKVPMAPLRQVLTAAGLVDVRTYIQSGNVLARSRLTAAQVETLVHDQINQHFGADLVVMARTPMQVRRIFVANPFTNVDATKVHFTILGSAPEADSVQQLASEDFHPDEFAITAAAVYLYCPLGLGTTKLSNNFFERRLGVAATTRNHRTMSNLIELSAEPPYSSTTSRSVKPS